MNALHLLQFFSFLFLLTFPASGHIPVGSNDANIIHMDIPNSNGAKSEPSYTLKLTRAEESVLHPNIKVIQITDENNELHPGKSNQQQQNIVSVDTWTPSKAELKSAQDLYIDAKNLAAVRLGWDEDKKQHVAKSGVVNGNKVENGSYMQREARENHTDYIDIGRKITPSKQRQSASTPVIVEVALICDKEFGDVFSHNRQRILDYFTVYFWDVNLRYKTLPGSNISFRITSIVIISSKSGQPFIEEARAADGRAEFGRILPRFGDWIYGQMSALPKFDMGIAITNTQLEWGGGLAYVRAACLADPNSRRHWGTLVWNDDGTWGSLTVGAHEIGHNLGAPHDDDPNFPGGCSDRGYIMSGGNDDLKWFFSTCSNRVISEFVQSNEGSCLRRLDETNQSPAIPTDFANVLAPTMEEQCRRRLNNPQAFIPEEDTANCKVMKCWVNNENGNGWLIWSLPPVDNTLCRGGGRCFRGRCRKIGNVLQNVGTGTCVRAGNAFTHMGPLQMGSCPNPRRGATPLDTFVVEDSNSNGKFLQTPWNTPDAKENGDKCVWTGNAEGDTLWTDRCNLDNGWQGWNMNAVGRNGEFMLQHRITRRCAAPAGNDIRSYGNCDSNNSNMRWKFI